MRIRAFAPAILPYQRGWLRADLLAGLATAAVVIPQAMAYATVANLPPQFGLYTCMLPLVVYAFVGGSRTASVSTTSTIATLTASTMLGAGIAAGSPDAPSELVTLTLLVGVILLVARVLRLASLVENINEATLIGIKAGVGLTVAATQLPKLLGVPGDPDADGFLRTVLSMVRHLGDVHLATVALAVASIAILLAMSRFVPAVPGPLLVVVLGIGLAAGVDLPGHGVALIPEVPQGIPLPGLPSLDHVGGLLPGALAIALMAFLETVAVARGVRRPDEPPVEPDRELAASSMSALVGSFFHALPPSAGFSQSSVNARAGAKSQVAGLVTAALAVLVSLFLAHVLSMLPQATLGAMVLVATLGLVDITALARLYRYDRVEFGMAVAVAVFALTAGLLRAIAVGVVLTLYLVLREINTPNVIRLVRQDGAGWHEAIETAGATETAAAPTDPLVLRFGTALYTANLRSNTAAVHTFVEAAGFPGTVILDLRRLPKMSSTVLDGLRDFETELAPDGVRIVYACLSEHVHTMVRGWPWWQQVESEGRYFTTIDDAVNAVR
ncbi:STAS domain-containing protein [Mycobacterium sp. Y57]|uniref:SulP family inorganic anion transporter n=1 Tax=Mycolicibacterium xanthum TaxID=2796469 RepID=UPI001C85EAA1|nr:SulP family inorganic anion transporter [Mycolicibacterium xanthum]MBX7433220.1 STAS domain-containing protein [Mycolicibacterium xanthum]